MLEIPCAACTRRAANPEAPWWRDLLAELDLGHDQIAHRTYWALIQRGITGRRLETVTDAELLALPSFGAGMLARLRGAMPAPASGCVFCDIATGRKPATVVRDWPDVFAIVPLNPVVEGHTLVIPKAHVRDATVNPAVTGAVMRRAAQFAREAGGDCNLITSMGPAATQSVPHLHAHVVPRSAGDGLPLPWTPQQTGVAS
jgi:histidine triad (HIT) family protein